MLSMVISACLIAEPNKCKNVSLMVVEDKMTPHQCMSKGQLELIKWFEIHPEYFLQKWSCGKPSKDT